MLGVWLSHIASDIFYTTIKRSIRYVEVINFQCGRLEALKIALIVRKIILIPYLEQGHKYNQINIHYQKPYNLLIVEKLWYTPSVPK